MSRSFSKIAPDVWGSKRFLSTPGDSQRLHLYYMTCRHQNSAGGFMLPDGYACSDLSWPLDAYQAARTPLIGQGLIFFDEQTSELFVDKWFKHNPPMNDRHAIGTQRLISNVNSDLIREKMEEQFEEAESGRVKLQSQRENSANVSRLQQRRADPFSR